MAPPVKSRFRSFLRAIRVIVLLLLLAVVGLGVYVHTVGLPGFIKAPLLQELRDRGLELKFTRLRLHWQRGIIAENVQFGRSDTADGPQLRFKDIEVRINKRKLASFEFHPESLVLRQGTLVWPLFETNRPNRALFIDDIQTVLRLQPDDLWELDRFQARFAGARMQLAGALTNASDVRHWQFLRPAKPADATAIDRRLRQLLDTMERLTFASAPELSVAVHGDARDLRSFNGHLVLSAAGADTPWGKLGRGHLTARVNPPPDMNSPPQAELSLDTENANTPWGNADQVKLTLGLVTDMAETNMAHAEMLLKAEAVKTEWGNADRVLLTLGLATDLAETKMARAELLLKAEAVKTEWGEAASAQFQAEWSHRFTNAIPLEGHGELQLTNAKTRWGEARAARIHARLATPSAKAPAGANEQWAWWTALEPYELNWETTVRGLSSPRLAVDEIEAAGLWRAPQLVVSNLAANLYGGQLNASAELDVVSRALRVDGRTDFDLHKISPLLTPKSQQWISQFAWTTPPDLGARLTVVLPAWTNRTPDWRGEVRPTVFLSGEVKLDACSFREVPAYLAQTHFTYSNMTWRLPDLAFIRPEGRVDIHHEANDRTQDYYWRVRSSIDLHALRPLFGTNADRAFDLVEYAAPPVVDAEVWGRWHRHDSIGARGHVSSKAFKFRGESADALETDFAYTNKVLRIIRPMVRRGEQQATADGLEADFMAQKIYLTNGVSRLDPMSLARAIGPKTSEAIEPYRFLEPPLARVHGTIPIRNVENADLHFELEGGPFAWWLFHTRQIKGDVHWLGRSLSLTNVQMEFYSGQAAGNASFKFEDPEQGTDFKLNLSVANASLHSLMSDVHPGTNRLEGSLGGELSVTSANSRNPQSWQGSGRVTLTDGLIWEIPIFGIFSPILNVLMPGLGSSRAEAGSATFFITDGVIQSQDLEIRASVMRMQYRGTVDFRGQVDARVEVKLLRDAWLIGRAVSLLFSPLTKLFEYKVTGTLSDPRSEPTYVPKVFMFPLHPFRTLKELLQIEDEKPPKQPPPVEVPKP